MIKYKNTKKDFGEIGKRWHNFDLKSEKKYIAICVAYGMEYSNREY